jgi:DNA-binding transcriptional LysR family regulator
MSEPVDHRPVNLANVDVNLIVALDALLGTRSVTQAAKRMGLSQPAMSHILHRLRATFGDPLLVRVGRRMELTQRAEALAARITPLVRDIEGLFGVTPPPFDPAESRRTFRLAAPDHVQQLLLPALYQLLREQAPHVAIHARPLSEATVVHALRSGELDLVLGPFADADLPIDIYREELFRDRYVGLIRVHHPKLRLRISMEAYVDSGHLAVLPLGATCDPVDKLLARHGISRRIEAIVPHMLVAPHVIASSDLVATVPDRLAFAFSAMLPLARAHPPFELAAPEIVMLWHERVHDARPNRWFRRMMDHATQRFTAPGRRGRMAASSR